MRSYTWTTRLTAGAVAAAGLSLLVGCSTESGKDESGASTASSPQATATTEAPTPTVKPGEVATSPAGVTTAVGADAQSTEEEYFQACHAAKTWMQAKGGDLKTQVEPYLASVQAPDAAPGPGTYNVPWAQLEPARQAAVIVAAQAAADELCS
ncbi:lipoprotein LpqV [Mycolicibacterium neworleansense]|uniref:LpqV protein n=1 Tax=Mycolicibacterium neworleansense TaxID=146018 RepID=A0A0H5RX22_9MYCO|nr:lipoprotein LpqV [Mycolicibacterium neworleansense]MCV7361209.1 lipoprotein LpqV [Mycolicibacterium neworleansense]CRZ18356.1 LpqV protein [Mycolicibacterium neworleansense]